MSAKETRLRKGAGHNLRSIQTELLADLYPSFAANFRAMVRGKAGEYHADPKELANAERWLFHKYRTRAEKEGHLDRQGWPTNPNPALRPSSDLGAVADAFARAT